jgi:NADPH-dependent FMN reductase
VKVTGLVVSDFKILGLAGSLQRASLHRGLVKAAQELAPEGVKIEPYEALEKIPFFNQDVEAEGDLAPVRELKEKSRPRTPSGSRHARVRLRYPRRPHQRPRLGPAPTLSLEVQAGRERGAIPGNPPA